MPWPTLLGKMHRWREPLALRVAGRAGSLADLMQVGRKTGLVRHTPVRAFRRGEQIVIGANFGAQSQWVRNVLAAGECDLTLRRNRFHLIEPRMVPFEEAAHLFPGWFAWGLRRLARTEDCVVLRIAPTGP